MVIKKTVARLPLPAVLPLVEEVSVIFHEKMSRWWFLFVTKTQAQIFCHTLRISK